MGVPAAFVQCDPASAETQLADAADSDLAVIRGSEFWNSHGRKLLLAARCREVLLELHGTVSDGIEILQRCGFGQMRTITGGGPEDTVLYGKKVL